MFGIGGQELVLLMLIGLVVLGPERLPRIANQLGSWLGQARRMTRVMKRQLEEELDLTKPPTILPPPSSREPSFKPSEDSSDKTDDEKEDSDESTEEPEYTLPRDDDEYSPAHGEGEVGTGVSDELTLAEDDVAASDAEADAVAEAQASNPPDESAEEKKEAS